MTEATLRIFLLASTRLDRQALGLLLRNDLRLGVSFESGFVAVDVWTAMRENPDLAIASAELVTAEIRDCLQMIPRLRAGTRILALGGTLDPVYLRSWVDCGLSGYVFKDGGTDELRTAINTLAQGGTYFSPGAQSLIALPLPENGRPHLSRREQELLPLLAQGMKLREAATKMTVSYKTADAYRTSLLRKLGIRDRVELARYAIREGIVSV